MAAMEKYTAEKAIGVLRHNAREYAHSTNEDIDPARSGENYTLFARPEGAEKYLEQRLRQVYHTRRKDLIHMVEWVVTLPADCPAGKEREFFGAVNDFLLDRYADGPVTGSHINALNSVVHVDEGGRPHLHFDFIPICEGKRLGDPERLCANDICTRADMRSFHGDLQKYIDAAGIPATVVDRSVVTTGKTLRQQYAERGERRPRSWRPQNRKLDDVRDRPLYQDRERQEHDRVAFPRVERDRSRMETTEHRRGGR